MTTAIQHEFDLPIMGCRPLWPVSGVMVFLDRSEDDVLNLIERGLLYWVFDLRGKGAERAEWRIWKKSVLMYAANKKFPQQSEVPFRDVCKDILGVGMGPKIRTPRLARNFCCSATHITNLAEAGFMTAANGHDGTNRRLEFDRASVIAFLQSRSPHGKILTS